MKKSWFFFLLVLIACSQESRTSREKPLREVNYEGIFAIEIPEFLKPAKYLSDIAVLQYANLVKEFYVLVLMENKEKFNGITKARNLSESYPTDVRGYADFMVDLWYKQKIVIEELEKEATKINGLPAILFSFYGEYKDTEVYMYLAFLEGKHHFYQLVIWTEANRGEEYKEQMRDIIFSFKETGEKS